MSHGYTRVESRKFCLCSLIDKKMAVYNYYDDDDSDSAMCVFVNLEYCQLYFLTHSFSSTILFRAELNHISAADVLHGR